MMSEEIIEDINLKQLQKKYQTNEITAHFSKAPATYDLARERYVHKNNHIVFNLSRKGFIKIAWRS